LSWAKEFDTNFYEKIKDKKDFCVKLFDIDRNNNNPRKDIAKWSMVSSLYSYMFDGVDSLKLEDYDFDSKFNKEDIIAVLNSYKKVYDKKDDKQTWFEKIKALCPELGFCDNMKEYKKNPEAYKGNVADVSGIIRVAITTRRNSPDLYEIMNLLGDKEVKNRINKAIDLLK